MMKQKVRMVLILMVLCLCTISTVWVTPVRAKNDMRVVYKFDCSEEWVAAHTEGVDYKGVKFGTSADLQNYYFIKFNQITLGANYVNIGEYDLSTVDVITFDVTNGGESVFKPETRVILSADQAGETVLAEFEAIDGTGWGTPITSTARINSNYTGPVYVIFRNAGATDGYQIDRFRFYAIDESTDGDANTETLPDDGHSLPYIYRFTGSPAWFYSLDESEILGVEAGITGGESDPFYLKFNMKPLRDNYVYIGDYDLSCVRTLTYFVTNASSSTFGESACLLLCADREGKEIICRSSAVGGVGWDTPHTVIELLHTEYSGPLYLIFHNGGSHDSYQVADFRFYEKYEAESDITILPPETESETLTETTGESQTATDIESDSERTSTDDTTDPSASDNASETAGHDGGCHSSLFSVVIPSAFLLLVAALLLLKRSQDPRRASTAMIAFCLATALLFGGCTSSGMTETADGTDPPANSETASDSESDSETETEGEVQAPTASRDLLTFTPADPAGQVLTEDGNSPQILIHNYNESAIDALGRSLPTSEETGLPRENKYVGLFYFLWASRDGSIKTNTDVSKLLACNPENPDYGGIGHFCWWAEPETGYRRSSDIWIIKRDMYYFSMAGVDFIYIDFTNGFLYEEGFTALLDTCLALREEGIMTPYIVPWAHGTRESNGGDMGDLYEKFYKNEKYDDLWFRWDGKPLAIIRHVDNNSFPILSDKEMTDYFTFRIGWSDQKWPGKPTGFGKWDDNHIVNYGYAYGWWDNRREAECVAIGTAGFANYGAGRSGTLSTKEYVDKFGCTDTMGEGLVFEAAFNQVMEKNPEAEVLLLSRWNEAAAQYWAQNDFGFVDEYSPEFSRDMEPVKGLFGDNYFYQMCSIIRRFKGVLPPDGNTGSTTVNLEEGFRVWQEVLPVYTDFAGDTSVRDDYDVTGTIHYENRTGRNDIVESRITSDAGNLYVYARTREAITMPAGRSNWMLLFIDTDNRKSTGFEGYDILINNRVIDESTTTLSVWKDGVWQEIASLAYRVEGCELMVSIPRSLAGLTGDTLTLHFHWLDNVTDIYCLDAWFTTGDSAPERRNNYTISMTVPYDQMAEKEPPAAAPEAERLCFMPSVDISSENSPSYMTMTYYPLPTDYGKLPDFDRIEDLAALRTDTISEIHAHYGPRYADYALLFEGYIDVEADERYTFSLICDDGAKLYIDGRLVVDGSYVAGTDTTGTARTICGSIRLARGYHTIRIEYAECVGNGGAYLDLTCDQTFVYLTNN